MLALRRGQIVECSVGCELKRVVVNHG
jgi:hypothetical protein